MATFDAQSRGHRSHGINFLKGRAHAILIQWPNIFFPLGETATVNVCPLCEGIPNRHGDL